MSSKRWLDNAFWETEEKEMLNCILEIRDDIGRVHRSVMKIKRYKDDGSENPDFNEVVEALTEKSIDDNTEERRKRKNAEREEKRQREVEHAKARKLEKLFDTNSKHSKLKKLKTPRIVNSSLNSAEQRTKSKLIFML